MAEERFQAQCPGCKKKITVTVPIQEKIVVTKDAPEVHSKIKPAGTIQVYKFSSDDIRQFLIMKAREYVPNIKLEVVPVYCEAKKRKNFEPHRSYASLRVAFSEEAVENKNDMGWFQKIGESGGNVKLVKTLFEGFVSRYRYNRKEIEKWLSNYKIMEELEEGIGMSEKYIKDLLMYCTPQRIRTNDKESWIFFSAAAENVIKDMLSAVSNDKPFGKIEIQDVYPISKGLVEFVVYVHPNEMKMKENPHVRQILLGEEKAKN